MATARFTVRNEAATLALAACIARLATPGMLILLDGPLAAGKTTFARGFLRALGHAGKVKSPTFTVVESYLLGGRRVHHFDLYRINDPDELHYLGFDDFLASQDVCLIEWPSRAGASLPPPSLRVALSPRDHDARDVALETSLPGLQKALEDGLSISFDS